MNDPAALCKLYSDTQRWDEAFAVASRHPELLKDINVPYAHWLVEHDRFQEAQVRCACACRLYRGLSVFISLYQRAI
jgi:intraflagellar transport protein 122